MLQVLPKAILLGAWYNRTLDPYTDKEGTEHSGSAGPMEEPLLIVGVQADYVDGSSFSGVIYPAGRTNYTSVLGTKKTVLRYASSPEIALQYVNSQ